MAITLGKNHVAPPAGAGIISATYTEEMETVDVSNRESVGNTGPGFRQFKAGFKTRTWEIECHDGSALVAAIEAEPTAGFMVMNVTENISVDGAVTYSVTAKEV